MKSLFSGTITMLLLAGVFFSATTHVHAQTYIDLEADSKSTSEIEVSPFRPVPPESQEDASNETDSDPDTATSSSRADVILDVKANTDVKVAPGDKSVIAITQAEAAEMSIDAESAELSSTAVETQEDLSLFATAQLKRDPDFRSVTASSDQVDVAYRTSADFLGFFPTSIVVRASVTSEGDVTVDYPWYRFLFAVGGNSNLETQLESEIEPLLTTRSDMDAEFSASMEAQIIDALHATLSNSADVSGTASGELTDDVSADGAATGSAANDTVLEVQ